MFSFFTGKNEDSRDPNIRLYQIVMDNKLTPRDKIAHIATTKNSNANGLYLPSDNKNVFNLAYAKQDIETFKCLCETFSIKAAFNPSQGKNWLTLALDANKIDFIQVYFDTKEAFTEDDVHELNHKIKEALLSTFVTALASPRLYHLIEQMLTKIILPILNFSTPLYDATLVPALTTHGESIFKTLAYQAGNPPTKSTQLLGLLIKHGFITACEYDHSSRNTRLRFKNIAGLNDLPYEAIDKNDYYVNSEYLLKSPDYNKEHAALLHCHHYFVMKQKVIFSKADKREFDEKCKTLADILYLIKTSVTPAESVKMMIQTLCEKKTGESHFRDTIYPLATFSDEALKESYAAYLHYLNTINEENNDSITMHSLTQALYKQRSNPFTEIEAYLDDPHVKKRAEKQLVFEHIRKICEETPIDRNQLKQLPSRHPYTSTPQVVSPPKVSPFIQSQAHVVWPHRGKFANLIRGLKHWDMTELQKKYQEYPKPNRLERH